MFLKKFKNIVFIDTETTGINPTKNTIIEFAAVKTSINLKSVLNQVSFTICPDNFDNVIFDPQAMKINNISLEEIKRSVKASTVKEQIINFFDQDTLVVGHNFSFDLLFLSQFLGTEFVDKLIKPRIIDTASLVLPLVVMGKIKRNSLAEACQYFKIDRKDAHRALNDALMTFQLFKKLTEFYKNCEQR